MEAGWSPDSGRLVIRNQSDCPGGVGCTNLFTVNADGSGRAPLVTAPGFETHPRWSPDGSFIAYVANRTEPALYVIDAEGLGTEQMLSPVGSIGVPAWSPDGLRLAFTSVSGEISVVNRDGTGLAVLTDMADTSSEPFWSPDGQKVAFQNGGDVHVVNANGTSRRPANYTKTKRAAEAASSWQKLLTP
jgi:Tol biopolymer transport system component